MSKDLEIEDVLLESTNDRTDPSGVVESTSMVYSKSVKKY